jgi:hypothetical protein
MMTAVMLMRQKKLRQEFSQGKRRMKTRCKDKTGTWIYEGDILHVEEYPNRYVGGSYDFEGVVVIENGRAMVTYLDIGKVRDCLYQCFRLRGDRYTRKSGDMTIGKHYILAVNLLSTFGKKNYTEIILIQRNRGV